MMAAFCTEFLGGRVSRSDFCSCKLLTLVAVLCLLTSSSASSAADSQTTQFKATAAPSSPVLLSPPLAGGSCVTIFRTSLDVWLCTPGRGGALMVSGDLGITWKPIAMPDEFDATASAANQWPTQFQVTQQSPLSSRFYLVRRDLFTYGKSPLPSPIWLLQLDATLVNCTSGSSGTNNSHLFPTLPLFTPMDFTVNVKFAPQLNLTAYPKFLTIGLHPMASDPSGQLLVIAASACADDYGNTCMAGRMASSDGGKSWNWGPAVADFSASSALTAYGVGYVQALNSSGIATDGVFISQLCASPPYNPWVVLNCSAYVTPASGNDWRLGDPAAWTLVWSNNQTSFLEQGAPTLILTASTAMLLRPTDYVFGQAPFAIQPIGFVTSGWQLIQMVQSPGGTPTPSQVWSAVVGPQLLSPASRCAFFPMAALESFEEPTEEEAQTDLIAALLASSHGVSVAYGNDCGSTPNGAFVCRHNWTLASAGSNTLDQWQCAIVNTSSSELQGLYASGYVQSISTPTVELLAGGTVFWRANDTNFVTNSNGNFTYSFIASNVPSSVFMQYGVVTIVSAISVPNSTMTYTQGWAMMNFDSPVSSGALLDYHSAPTSADWTNDLNQKLPFFICLPVYHDSLQAMFAISESGNPAVAALQASYDGQNFVPAKSSFNFGYNDGAAALTAVHDAAHPEIAPILALVRGSDFGSNLYLGDASDTSSAPTIRNASQLFVNWTLTPLKMSIALRPVPTVIRRNHTVLVAVSSAQFAGYPVSFSRAILYRGLIDPLTSIPSATVRWQPAVNLTTIGCDDKYRVYSIYPRRRNDASVTLASSPSAFFLTCPSLGAQPPQSDIFFNDGLTPGATAARWMLSEDGANWRSIQPIGAPTIGNISAPGSQSVVNGFAPDPGALPLPTTVSYSNSLRSFLLTIDAQLWLCNANLDRCSLVWLNPFNSPLTVMELTDDGVLVGSFDAFMQFVPIAPTIANQTDHTVTVAELEAVSIPTVCTEAAEVGPSPWPPTPIEPVYPVPKTTNSHRAMVIGIVVGVIIVICLAFGCWYADKRGVFESLRRRWSYADPRPSATGLNSSSDANDLGTRFVPME